MTLHLDIRPPGVQENLNAIFTPLEEKYDLPPGILNAVQAQEDASLDPNATSDGTHVGPFQLGPEIAKQYGVQDRTNLRQSAEGAAKFLSDRYNARDGNLPQTLADYNWGMGNVNNHGLENAPPETTDYIDKVSARMGVSVERPLAAHEVAAYTGSSAPVTSATAPAAPTGEMSEDDIAKYTDPVSQITPNSTEAEIIKAYGGDPKQIMSSPIYRPGMFNYANTSAPLDPTSAAGVLGKSWVGTLARGAQDVPEAIGQLEGHLETALGSNPANQAVRDLSTKINENYYNQQQKGRSPGDPVPLGEQILRGVGSMAVPIPGVGPLAGVAGSAASAAIKGTSIFSKVARAAAPAAVVGAVAAPLASPVTNLTPDGSNTGFAGEKAKQAEAGAAGGAVITPLAKVAAGGAIKLANATGKLSNTAMQELDAVAKKYGVKLSYGDMSGNKLAQHTQQALENVPELLGGTGGVRAAQEHAVTAATKQLSGEFYDKMINAKFQNMREINKAASIPNGPRQKEALAILDKIRHDKDWTDIIQSSGDVKVLRTKLISDKKYDKVEQLAGNSNVWVTNTNKAIDDAIAKAGVVKGTSGDAIVKELGRLKQDFNNPKQPNTYAALRETRTALASKIDSMTRGSDPDSYGASIIQGVREGIRADLDKFGTNSKRPDLKIAADSADKFYKDSVVPLQARKLGKLYDNDEPDRIYSAFIKADHGDRAEQFYKALDTKGQSAVRYGMVREAVQRAEDEKGSVDSKKFSKYLDDIQDAKNVFFKGADKWELNGFRNLMNHVNDSHGGTSKHLLLGALVGEGLIGHLADSGVKTAAAATGTMTLTRWLMTSPAGKKILLSASDATPGSPMMAKIIARIQVQLPNLAGNIAGNKEQCK